MQRFIQLVNEPNVGTTNVAISVPVPAGIWGLIKRLAIFPNQTIVTIPGLSLTDVPAILLRQYLINRLMAPGGNVNFQVRMPSGVSDVTGYIIGLREP